MKGVEVMVYLSYVCLSVIYLLLGSQDIILNGANPSRTRLEPTDTRIVPCSSKGMLVTNGLER